MAIFWAISGRAAAAQPAPAACSETVLPKTRTVASANGSAALPAATSIDWQRLALDREDGGDLTGALAADTCALALDDSDGRTYYHRAQIQTALKNYRAALEDYQRAIDQEFNQPFVYFEQALALLAVGEIQKTMETFAKITQQKASDSLKAQALNNLSILRLQYPQIRPNIDALQPVERDFDAAVQLAPKEPIIYYNRGVFRLLQRELTSARQDFNKNRTLPEKDFIENRRVLLKIDPAAYLVSVNTLDIAFQDNSNNPGIFANVPLIASPGYRSITYKYAPALRTYLLNQPYLYVYLNDLESELDWQPYIEQLQAQIKNYWNTEKIQVTTKTVVQFDVISSGTVQNLRIIDGSGNKDSDTAAIEAINASSPFNLLPVQYTNREEGKRRVTINFTFDINARD
ncbi:energy transducer TonB [Gloeobacter kilaueensis]|uniref:energy transducer TonB n=1 Tax=Gloeobacter kilaueensis TaxID=1416614 RepID=UPI0004070B93|nr:energy transducer TonB [Gloeobacter kilaueensis]